MKKSDAKLQPKKKFLKLELELNRNENRTIACD